MIDLIPIKAFWWEEDLHLLADDDTEYTCKDAYPKSISFGELEYSSSEDVEIEMTTRYVAQNV